MQKETSSSERIVDPVPEITKTSFSQSNAPLDSDSGSRELTDLVPLSNAGPYKPYGVAPFTYGLWRHFVLLGALHLAWLFVLPIAEMAGYHGFDPFVISFLGLGGR